MTSEERVEREVVPLLRNLSDFDLAMIICEIDEHGLSVAEETLRLASQDGQKQ